MENNQLSLHALLDDLESVIDSGEKQAWAEGCARALGLGGIAVSLRRGDELVWFSDDISARLEDLQFTLGEGPGLSADWDVGAVPHQVVDVSGLFDEQWPQFALEAEALGVAAVFVWPVRVGAVPIGTLTGYRSTPGPLSEQQAADGLLVADVLAGQVLAWRPQRNTPHDGPGAAGTVDLHRVEVHQATGVLSVRLGVPMAEALVRLRAQAFAAGRPLVDVAREIIKRELPA
ncbi:ANTAR domain-containing protein [Streptomyces sp. NPDC053542]|uniref:ANTAR domain-containing protein n=1 Tax=Streptomyces sp. NPDC053542 TaxID=3365710 RepID=UPI0037CCCAFC